MNNEPCIEFLRGEGYAPQIQEDGSATFKYEGWVYMILHDEGDPEFFRLVLPNLVTVSDAATRREALDAANHASSTTKVAKIVVFDDGRVHGIFEMFGASPQDVVPVLMRGLMALQTAGRNFVAKLQEAQG